MLKVSEILKATRGKLICGSPGSLIRGISIDSRTLKPGNAFIALKGSNFDGHNFINEAIGRGANCIIGEFKSIHKVLQPFVLQDGPLGKNKKRKFSKGQLTFIEVKDTQEALGDIARFNRNKYDIPVIAVTGSAGKTTLKEMLARILSRRFNVLSNEGTKNNHIGLPLALSKANSGHDLAVLELGTNHFGEIANLAKICQPNIGVITNIGPAHLEYLNNLAGVCREKYALIDNLKQPRIAVLNADESLLRKKILKKSKPPVIFGFSIKQKSEFWASEIKYRCAKLEFCINKKYRFKLNTLGYNNIYNAAAAIAVARILGMGYNDISSSLADFSFPQGRLNLITSNNIMFIDDTYNSNPLSLRQALGALDGLKIKGRKIFIMGDMLELGRLEESFHFQAGLEAAKVCNIFMAVGERSKSAAGAARSYGLAIENIFTCRTSREARDILINKISPKKDDIVLIKGSRAMKMEEILR